MIETNFKHTEIGLIPHDWEVDTLGEIADVKTGPFGSALHASDYVMKGTPIITVEHIGDFSISRDKAIPMVGEMDRMRLIAYSLKENDIVFSRVGSVDRCSYVSAEEENWLFSGRLLRVRPKESLCSRYLTYHLSSTEARNRVLSVAVGLAMPSINTKILQGIKVILPSILAEQERIADALSKIDNLIVGLDELLEKKRAIKTGTMQQLLTGKKRIKGFTGEWDEVTIEDIISRFATGLNPRKNFVLNNGGYLYYVTIKDFKDGMLYFENCDRIDEDAFALIQKRADLRKGDLLFSSIGRVGDAYVIKEEPTNWSINESVYNLRPNYKRITSDFLFYMLKSKDVYNKLQDAVTGSTLRSIKMNHFKKISFTIPPTIDEQNAIASILSSMDTEIASLEQKRDKYIAIKQGMMQQLLTGKIRLV